MMMTFPDVPIEREIRSLAQEWFDLLSAHEPAERLLPFVADDGLEMAFPERTLQCHADFCDWYHNVGLAFSAQTHDIERLVAVGDASGADVSVTVIWRAVQTDGPPVAVRVDQRWRLVRHPEAGWQILGYQVGEMQNLFESTLRTEG